MTSTRRLLIIDDNVDAADLTADFLRLHDIEVDVAYGGWKGWQQLKRLCRT
jgi:DNA-binding response OmpR family regulator